MPDAYRGVLRQQRATLASCGRPAFRMLFEARTPHRGLPHVEAMLGPLSERRHARELAHFVRRQNTELAVFFLRYPSATVVLTEPLAYFPRCARARCASQRPSARGAYGPHAGSCHEAKIAYPKNRLVRSSGRALSALAERVGADFSALLRREWGTIGGFRDPSVQGKAFRAKP